MEIRFFSKVIFKPQDLMKKVKIGKKRYLYRAGSYLLKAARNNVKTVTATFKLKYTNEYGRKQVETLWRKSKEWHSPYSHQGWKGSFRFGVDEAAEVVDIGAIRGRNHIPPLHEFGETGLLKWTEYDKEGKKHIKTRRHTFARRPVMLPALQRSKQYISTFWKNAVSNY